jgi:hypothetical protein
MNFQVINFIKKRGNSKNNLKNDINSYK